MEAVLLPAIYRIWDAALRDALWDATIFPVANRDEQPAPERHDI